MRIAIGIPSRGMVLNKEPNVNLKGLDSAYVTQQFAENLRKIYRGCDIIHEHSKLRNVAQQRNAIINRALEGKYDYLWFIDDDVFPQPNALELLLKAKKSLISGIYWNKTEKEWACIGGYPYNWDGKPVFPLKKSNWNCGFGCGFGCCLIDTKILRRLKKPIVPPYYKPGGSIYWGEDNAFFHKVTIGLFKPKLWIHQGVLCDHYDFNKDKWFPCDDTCYQLVGRRRFCESMWV